MYTRMYTDMFNKEYACFLCPNLTIHVCIT